jgi:hypothetical protein
MKMENIARICVEGRIRRELMSITASNRATTMQRHLIPEGLESLKISMLEKEPYYIRSHFMFCTGNCHGTYMFVRQPITKMRPEPGV